METMKVRLGALLLLISSAILLATGTVGTSIPSIFAAVAALGMAAGSLLIGTSGEGRPV